MLATAISAGLLVKKGVFYVMVTLGSILPDMDNAHSMVGHRLGWVSREIQHVAGHRRFCHSLLGLALGGLVALGLEQLVISLLAQRGLVFPARFIGASHLVVVAVLFGCLTHLAADGLTEGGVPLLWPSHKRFGFPPNPHWRFRSGSWPEFVIDGLCLILVALGMWYAVLRI
jgi:inner membrane protein